MEKIKAILKRDFRNIEPIPYSEIIQENSGQPHECHFNVLSAMKRDGGNRVTGYCVQLIAKDLLSCYQHSLWRTTKGNLVELTPDFSGCVSLFFLPVDWEETIVMYRWGLCLETPHQFDRYFGLTPKAKTVARQLQSLMWEKRLVEQRTGLSPGEQPIQSVWYDGLEIKL